MGKDNHKPPSHVRRFARIQLATQVRIEGPGLDAVRPYKTHDVSAGGLFVATLKPLPLGKRVHIRMVVHDEYPAIDATAEVVRIVPPEADSSVGPGMALKFVDMDAAEQQRIHDLLQHVRS